MFQRCPYGLNLCLPLIRVNRRFTQVIPFWCFTRYFSTIQLHRTREVNERLCIGEVGVDLELCVHAHGHDVDLIIKASVKLIIPSV